MNAEQEIISILLNRPEQRFGGNINPEWFSDKDLGYIYETIRDVTDDDYAPEVMVGVAKYRHAELRITTNELEDIKNGFVTAAQFQTLTAKLHRSYLYGQLNEQLELFQQAPVEAAVNQIGETVSAIKAVDTHAENGALESASNELIDSLEHRRDPGISTGFNELDKILGGGLYSGMLMTIGARPAKGKSAFCLNVAYQIAQLDATIRIDYFSLEMPQSALLNRLVSTRTGISSQAIKNGFDLTDGAKQRIAEAAKYFAQSQINAYTQMPELGSILATIRQHASECEPGKYVAFVDHIGLISVAGKQDRYLQVGEITRQFKQLTNEFNIPIVIQSQLNRSIESRQSKEPQLSDLRESGSIEQDSNVVGFLWEPNGEELPEVKVLSIRKNREGETGQLGFKWQPEKMKFSELKLSQGVLH